MFQHIAKFAYPALLREFCAIRTEFAPAYSSVTVTLLAESSSRRKALYTPKGFFKHAASLRQAFAHCEKFETAATRRCRDRVSVPVWLVVLSDQLPVSLGEPLPRQLADRPRAPLKAPGLAVPGFSRDGIAITTTCGIS